MKKFALIAAVAAGGLLAGCNATPSPAVKSALATACAGLTAAYNTYESSTPTPNPKAATIYAGAMIPCDNPPTSQAAAAADVLAAVPLIVALARGV